ncbi:GNAT family N-acetyltransferase [Chryseobacterium gallinarum]|uniref:GNAT family N-acetyltransferase n=1 Tax=Chryseobacterium gallinarum TaxID=1324352 RepID=A0ABX6KN35_CHRGL|nr:GNAT family N-acetyltransferase [Chryseobacterium gallinarum]QIY90037.1 GNAT family N-acetyltransferase [Chryseobacterium gallinarum]
MHYKNDTLTIREFTPEEFPLFSALFENENVTRYLPYKTREEYKEMFDKAIADYKEGPFSRWGIFNPVNNDCMGMCLARTFLDRPSQIEIGYTLGENYWGKGLGTEVCKALVEYCLSLQQEKDIVAVTDPDNIGSQKVLTKSGFKRIDNLVRENTTLAYFVFSKTSDNDK